MHLRNDLSKSVNFLKFENLAIWIDKYNDNHYHYIGIDNRDHIKRGITLEKRIITSMFTLTSFVHGRMRKTRRERCV
ncbi:hypothetical protein B1no1_07040 [Thermolongibacillus altinsuensis]|nr:hypothetical protein B1no1_07040 [Thermolongibacillus altinsuensis]